MATAVCGVATLAKDDERPNQDDCCAERYRETQELRVLAVADGLGSHRYSELASSAAIDGAILALRKHTAGPLAPSDLVREAQRRVVLEAQAFYEGEGRAIPVEGEYSTTLILAVEDQCEIRFAWLGNGAILQIQGAALLLESPARVPWQATNLMLPHAIANAQGKPALSRYISGSTGTEVFDPSFMSVSLDNDGYGDVFVLCTDGILTAEDKKIGRLKDGTYWQQVSEGEVDLFDLLKRIADRPGELTDDDVTAEIQSYLQAMHDAGRQSDDATLGVVLSRQFLIARKELRHQGDDAIGPGTTWSDLCQD